MLLPENLSPIFSNKSKSAGNIGDVRAGATNNSHDIIEHDVTGLTNMTNLPRPDVFEALQIGTDR
jgi:hypothetical protein